MLLEAWKEFEVFHLCPMPLCHLLPLSRAFHVRARLTFCFYFERLSRPIHTRDFAPGACSSVCTNDFMGILHPQEQNFHPTKCSTIFKRLNIWDQAPGANWANLKTLLRVYWHLQNELGACSGSKTPRVYRPSSCLQRRTIGRFDTTLFSRLVNCFTYLA